MYNKTELFRQALILCKDSGDITDYAEDSPGAVLCRTFYEMVRRSVLAAAPWPSARATAFLLQLHTNDDPLSYALQGPGFGFRYRYQAPQDMIAPIHLPGWEQFSFVGNAYIDANNSPAYLHYTRDNDAMETWEVGLYNSILYYLASHIAPGRTGDVQLAENYFLRARETTQQAAADFANQTEEYYESIPDWVLARGFSPTAPAHRFFYPFTPLSPVTGRLL